MNDFLSSVMLQNTAIAAVLALICGLCAVYAGKIWDKTKVSSMPFHQLSRYIWVVSIHTSFAWWTTNFVLEIYYHVRYGAIPPELFAYDVLGIAGALLFLTALTVLVTIAFFLEQRIWPNEFDAVPVLLSTQSRNVRFSLFVNVRFALLATAVVMYLLGLGELTLLPLTAILAFGIFSHFRKRHT